MGLIRAPLAATTIYAECNNAFGLTVQTVLWDTFYDRDQNTISGAPLTAALAGLRLSYSAGVFTALADIVVAFHLNISPVSAPALQGSEIVFSEDMFTGGSKVSWGVVAPATGPTNALPPEHAKWIKEVVFMKAADTISLSANKTGTSSAEVIDYADMAIIRLA